MCGSSYQPMMMSGPVPRLAARAALGRTSSQVMYSTLTGTPVASVNFFVLAFHSSSSDLTKPDQRKSRSDASFSGLNSGSVVAPCARAPPAASPTPHSSTVRREILGMRSSGDPARRIIALRNEFAKRVRSCGDDRHLAHAHQTLPRHGADAGRLHAFLARRVRARQWSSHGPDAGAADDQDR